MADHPVITNSLAPEEHQLDNHVDEEVLFKTVSGLSKASNSCDHLASLSLDLDHIPHPDTPCTRCHNPWENWLCLCCKVVLCGRFVNQHMLQHYQQTNHCLVLGYGDFSVWCYACNAYLNVQLIPQPRSLYETACRVKSTETLPFLTDEHIEDGQADGCDFKGNNQREGKKRRRKVKKKKSSLIQAETAKKSNETETPPERISAEGMGSAERAEGALGVKSSSTASESNQNGFKISDKQCLCGLEAMEKISESVENKNRLYYTCKENKCNFFECCFDTQHADTMLAENEALHNQVMNLVDTAGLNTEIQGLTARINTLESNFGLMKMMMLMNMLYGSMLMVVIVVVLFKV